MITFRKLAIFITVSLCLLLIYASLFGKYQFEGNAAFWFVLLLAAALVACFHYLRDLRLNLVLIMTFFVWMGLILRLAVLQLKGNVDAFVQYGDLTVPEYNRATLYICLACGSSLLGIILAGKSVRTSSDAERPKESRVYFGFLLILACLQITQFFYLFYLTPLLNQLTTYRPDELLGKVVAYFRPEFFVLSLFAVAMWLIRPLDTPDGSRWKALTTLERRLLLLILVLYPLVRLLRGNRGFLFEEVLQIGFAALAVYNFGELRLRLNLKRVAIIVLAVYLSSIGWFLVEQIRKEVFYSGATLSSLSFGKMVEAAAEEYDFSFFLAAASARVYLLDPAVLPINENYYTNPETFMSFEQSVRRSINRIVPLNSIKPFQVVPEESELAYYLIYHIGRPETRQSYSAPGLAYITFGWWGGLVLMFAVSYLTALAYKYVLRWRNTALSVIASAVIMYFYYEWWQTFGFDNLAYKMVWSSLTLAAILFCFNLFVGKRASASNAKHQVRELGVADTPVFSVKGELKGSING